MYKPGPLSKKKNIIAHTRGSLGDTSDESVSNSDDSSVERTASGGKENNSPTTRRRSTRHFRTSDSQFHSPDNEGNATDYGLEFTTTNIRNTSSRRYSSVRAASTGVGQQLSGAIRTREIKETNKKQTASKEAENQTDDNSDSDSDDEEEERPSVSGVHLREQQPVAVERSKGEKPQVASKKTKTQIPRKVVKGQNTGKQTRNQSTADDQTEEENRDGSRARRPLEEVNTTGAAATQGHSKRSTTTKQHPTQVDNAPTTSRAAVRHHAQSQQAAVTNATVQSQAATAKKKSRKQYNPKRRDKRFWREVNILQNRTQPLIPRLPFSRLVRELMMQASQWVSSITPSALEAIQVAAEMYMSQRLQDAYMLTLHRGRVTLEARDMQLINYLKSI